MRRMKIRATPNFGGGAAVQRTAQPRNKSFGGNPLADTGGNMALEESSTSKDSPSNPIIIVQEEDKNNIPKVTLDSKLDSGKEIFMSGSSNSPRTFEKQETFTQDVVSCSVKSVPFNNVFTESPSCSSNILDSESASHDLCKVMDKGEAPSLVSDTEGLHSKEASEVVGYLPDPVFSVKKYEDNANNDLHTGVIINSQLISDKYPLPTHESSTEIAECDILSASGDGVISAEVPEESRTLLENKIEGLNLSVGNRMSVLSKENNSSAFSGAKRSSPVSVRGNTRRSKLHAKPFLARTVGKKSVSQVKIETVDLVSGEDSFMNKEKKSPACAISEEASGETDNISDITNVDQQYSSENVASVRKLGTQLLSTPPETEKSQIEVIADIHINIAEKQNVISESDSIKRITSPNKTLSSTAKSVGRRSKIQARPSVINVAGKNSLSKFRTGISSSVNKNKKEEFVRYVEKSILATNMETAATRSTGENKSQSLVMAKISTSQVEKEEVIVDRKNYASSPGNDGKLPSDAVETVVRKCVSETELSFVSAVRKEASVEAKKDEVGKEVTIIENCQTSANVVERATLAHVGNNVRRSKIRAKPAFVTKRKASAISEKDIVSEDGAKYIVDGEDMSSTINLTERVEEQEIPTSFELLGKPACEENKNSIPEKVVQSPEKPPNTCDNTDDMHKTSIENKVNSDMKTYKSHYNQRNVTGVGSCKESSDDSCDDKENASDILCKAKTGRRERLHRETSTLPTYCRTRGKVSRGSLPNKKRPIKSEKNWKNSVCDDQTTEDGLEEKNEKQIFRERKEKYRRKISHGSIEREEMTMFDLIFWNPVNNPMPGRTDPPKKKTATSNRSEIDDATSDIIEEQMVDDVGLETHLSTTESDSKSSLSIKEGQLYEESPASPKRSQEGNEDATDDTEIDVFAPQVKIGPNGQIILDERSIKIQTTAAKNRDEILSKAEVVEESNDTAHYGKWSKKRRRSCEWTVKETARFYRALSTVGTDFSLMETLFKWRSRAELKTKFKKEERTNRDLVDRALKDYTQFDLSLFNDESDYDPEEDRKATRIAERAEAKRKRLEMKHSEKEQERCEKKKELKEKKSKIKARKSLLRKIRDDMKSKQKAVKCEKSELDAEENFDLDEDKAESERSADSKATSSVSGKNNNKIESGNNVKRKRPSHAKKITKQSKSKSRRPLEISEIVVTMETKKGIDLAQDELLIADFTVDEMTDCDDQKILLSPSSDPIAVGDSDAYCENLTSTELIPITLASEISDSKIFGNGPQEYTVLSSMTVNETVCSMDSYSSSLPSITLLEDDLMNKPSTSTQVVVTDSLSRENVPQSSSNTQILSSDEASECLPDQEIYSSQFSSDSVPGISSQDTSVPVVEEEQKVWEFPLSAVELHSDGRRTISVPTTTGQKSLPIPYLPPGTSGVMVVATGVPDSPGEYIYHVYTISPSGP